MLFYSEKCDHCRMLISILNVSENLSGMKRVCVDLDPKTRKRNSLVKELKIGSVPTIFSGSKFYVGDQAFQFVEQLSNQQEKPSSTKDDPIEKLKNVGHYSSTFNGLSDAFSSFGEEKPDPLERSFAFLDAGESLIVKDSIKEGSKKEISGDYEKLLQERSKLK